MAANPPLLRKHGGPGQPWLDQETFFLIDAYEERWYALNRGQLKAHQWEEVAHGVASRLRLPRAPKSGTQCRHKIEKLRQRFRAERLRPSPSSWPFFHRMARLDLGPSPLSARPPLEEIAENDAVFPDQIQEDDDDRPIKLRVEDDSSSGDWDLAATVRKFRRGFVRMEMRRLEIMKEMERDWIRMENRRTELMVESQKRLFEAVSSAVLSLKKAKR
ncbi:uncharacterized protein LOC144701793 [Wolffia australiana]